MKFVLILDLDDTLYDEGLFFWGGMSAVAATLSQDESIPYDEIFDWIKYRYLSKGRNHIIDDLLHHFKVNTFSVSQLVKTYRFHSMQFNLDLEIQNTLVSLARQFPLYLLTDGHKLVQRRKIEHLGLENLFRRTYVTNQYGRKYQKPSPYCFDLIRRRERITWDKIVYVGDNPQKDFLALNQLGGITVQSTQFIVRPNLHGGLYGAKFEIDSLDKVSKHLA